MQSFLNSPPGPLGAAGQSSNSTQPPNIFSNAASALSGRLNKGVEGFADRMKGLSDRGTALSNMIKSLLGADGTMAGQPGFPGGEGGPGVLPGLSSGGNQFNGLFGQGNGQNAMPPMQGGLPAARPQMPAMSGMPQPPMFNPTAQSMMQSNPTAGQTPGGGLLSRFMSQGR